ncbi:MAG: RidA family protein [Pseudomonadota bacterium]|nr:RidA family protein [Pseudomonadota bacterium]
MSTESKVIDGKARPLGKYPHFKKAGDFIFVSGTSSRRKDNSHEGAETDDTGKVTLDIKAQTHAVIRNIEAILKEADASLDDLVEVSTFLTDMAHFEGYNTVYGEYFDHTGPARTSVAIAQLPHPNIIIEIKAVAYKKE